MVWYAGQEKFLVLRQLRSPVGTSGSRGTSLIWNQSRMKSGSSRCCSASGGETASPTICWKSDATSAMFYGRKRRSVSSSIRLMTVCSDSVSWLPAAQCSTLATLATASAVEHQADVAVVQSRDLGPQQQLGLLSRRQQVENLQLQGAGEKKEKRKGG
ncbi:hypothetical protein EYF80_049767 [Liparis tanakae]|uniref:Uncharacterized protein n=1 Tax=Liparis tanakae TaxID=230148 RepID=A0A4Z2FIF4_9TELE|nr:hypothetical protein EYF80_049767 [Liparis tanakae]